MILFYLSSLSEWIIGCSSGVSHRFMVLVKIRWSENESNRCFPSICRVAHLDGFGICCCQRSMPNRLDRGLHCMSEVQPSRFDGRSLLWVCGAWCTPRLVVTESKQWCILLLQWVSPLLEMLHWQCLQNIYRLGILAGLYSDWNCRKPDVNNQGHFSHHLRPVPKSPTWVTRLAAWEVVLSVCQKIESRISYPKIVLLRIDKIVYFGCQISLFFRSWNCWDVEWYACFGGSFFTVLSVLPSRW